jgi:hypothetical protein
MDTHSSDSDVENPHGFAFAHSLDTIKRSKKERIAEAAEEEKDKKGFGFKDRKGGGSTNKDKLKFKPMSMVKQKKRDHRIQSYDKTKAQIKNLKQQLGKFKKHQKDKFKKKTKGQSGGKAKAKPGLSK